MPNVRAQIVGPLGDKAPSQQPGDQVGIWIQASDGSEVTITRREVRQAFQDAAGTLAQRRAATRQWVRQTVVAALGAHQISVTRIERMEFDDADGTLTEFGVS